MKRVCVTEFADFKLSKVDQSGWHAVEVAKLS